jgi:hypothetical protein
MPQTNAGFQPNKNDFTLGAESQLVPPIHRPTLVNPGGLLSQGFQNP